MVVPMLNMGGRPICSILEQRVEHVGLAGIHCQEKREWESFFAGQGEFEGQWSVLRCADETGRYPSSFINSD